MDKSMEVPQNIKNRTTIWFSNSTSRYLSEGNENTNSKDICTKFIYNSHDREAASMSTDGWMYKVIMVSMYNEYYSVKTHGNLNLKGHACMDELWGHYAKW